MLHGSAGKVFSPSGSCNEAKVGHTESNDDKDASDVMTPPSDFKVLQAALKDATDIMQALARAR